MLEKSLLGIKKIFSLEFVVDYFDRSRDFYVEKMGFCETHRSTPEWENKFNSKGVYLKSNNIRILVSTPKAPNSYTAEYLKILPPGIRRANFQVEDLDSAVKHLETHGATFIHPVKEIKHEGSTWRFTTIATPMGFLEFTFFEINGDEDHIPMFERLESSKAECSLFDVIDHLTINARTLFPVISFFEHVMDFKPYWKVAFHTPDNQSGQKGTGLASRVMWDPGSRIKFASNEPLFPHYNDSQIQTFVLKNRGPGIQHAALTVNDIVEATRNLRGKGIEFLHTPSSYYRLLSDRLKSQGVENIKESIADLEEQGILVDGKDEAYLLQIFLKDASEFYHDDQAGPFFFEIIQRKGHDGFGEGNFKALFEAIELQDTAV
jgi:4-hydroxyphenylpyruvate dioxygenase